MATTTLPVLIIGAGPVGLTLALSLTNRGVAVRIVDKAAHATDKSKALVIWPRTLELLAIEGVAQPYIEAGIKATGARIHSDEGRELVHVELSTARSEYSFGLMIAQCETERLLGEQLAARGVTVERNVELASFEDKGDHVEAVLWHYPAPAGDDAAGAVAPAAGADAAPGAGMKQEVVRAQYLAGCDGAHSTVRHGLKDAKFEGHTLESHWILADIVIDGERLRRDELGVFWSPHGVTAFFPIVGNRMRVIADVPETDDTSPVTVEQVQAVLNARVPIGLTVRDPVWLNRFRINERKVASYRGSGRVFVGGDAAHVHSPAGGQGMNTGMQDAFNLGWKLAMVIKGAAKETLLASYSPERSGVGDQVLRNAGTMTKVALITNPIMRELRTLAATAIGHLPSLKQRFADQLTEVDLHYPTSPLTTYATGYASHPAPGERVPNGALPEAASIYGLLHAGAGRFLVLTVGAEAKPAALTPRQAALATSAAAPSVAGMDGDHTYLIRPDAYLATSGRDAAVVLAALDQLAA